MLPLGSGASLRSGRNDERRGWRLPLAVVAVALLLLGAAPAFAQSADPAPANATPKWGAHIDLQGKLGNRRDLGIGDLFLPVAQNADTLVFGDIRARFDDRDNREGNFGLGVRHMLSSGWNLGGYGYFDRRSTAYGNDFNQITLGAEALSLDWDVRANTYWPVGDRVKDVDSLNTATISGTSVTFRGGEEVAMRGFDGEVGWRVPAFDARGLTQLRLYGGGYRFTADNVDSVQGPRARLELTIDDVPHLWQGSRLVLGAEIQHDGPRGTQEFATVSLRVPLEIVGAAATHPSSFTPMERRMTDAVVRDVDIVSRAGAFGAPETVTQTADGTTFTVIDSGSTSGANLNTALTTAGANSTVILSGTFNTTATTTLQSGQTVMGSGSVTVKTPSGRTATLTTSAATISDTAATATPAVTMAANSTLTGMTVTHTGSGTSDTQGVLASGVSGATISNNTINATQTGSGTARGIDVFSGSSNVTVSGNAVTATSGTGDAATVEIDSSSATVSDNTLTAIGGAGHEALALVVGTSTVTAAGNTLSASGGASNFHTAFVSGVITVNAGSTGNSLASTNTGTCRTGGTVTGSIGYTDGSTCP